MSSTSSALSVAWTTYDWRVRMCEMRTTITSSLSTTRTFFGRASNRVTSDCSAVYRGQIIEWGRYLTQRLSTVILFQITHMIPGESAVTRNEPNQADPHSVLKQSLVVGSWSDVLHRKNRSSRSEERR